MMWDGMKGNTRTVNIMVKEFPVILGGSKYEGKWKDGKFHGQGTYTFSDGNKGVGEFRYNKPWNITTYKIHVNIIGKYVNGIKQ